MPSPDSLFELYEPQTEYRRAVQLRPDNFDAVATELGTIFEYRIVSKALRCGAPQSITVTPVEEDTTIEPVTCNLYDYLILRWDGGSYLLDIGDRVEMRRNWRRYDQDPYRS